MSNKGWFNLEAAGGTIPDTQFFEGDSAFKFLSLSRTQRLYGFVGCIAIGFLLSILGSIVFFCWIAYLVRCALCSRHNCLPCRDRVLDRFQEAVDNDVQARPRDSHSNLSGLDSPGIDSRLRIEQRHSLYNICHN